MFGKNVCNLLGLFILFILFSTASLAQSNSAAPAVIAGVNVLCSFSDNDNTIYTCVPAPSSPITHVVQKVAVTQPGLTTIPKPVQAFGIANISTSSPADPTPGHAVVFTTTAVTVIDAALAMPATGVTSRGPDVSASPIASPHLVDDFLDLPISSFWPTSTRVTPGQSKQFGKVLDSIYIGSADDSLVEHLANSKADAVSALLAVSEVREQGLLARVKQVEQERDTQKQQSASEKSWMVKHQNDVCFHDPNPKSFRRYRDDFEDRPHPDPFGKAILYLFFALAVAQGILYLSGLLKRKALRIWDQIWTQVWKRAQEEVDRIRASSVPVSGQRGLPTSEATSDDPKSGQEHSSEPTSEATNNDPTSEPQHLSVPTTETTDNDPTSEQQQLSVPISEAIAAGQTARQEDATRPLSELLVADSTANQQAVPISDASLMSRKISIWHGSIHGNEEGKERTVFAQVTISPIVPVKFPAPREAQSAAPDIRLDVSSDGDDDSSAEDAKSPADVDELVEADSDAETNRDRQSSDDEMKDRDVESSHHEGSNSDSDSESDGNSDDAGGAIIQRSQQTSSNRVPDETQIPPPPTQMAAPFTSGSWVQRRIVSLPRRRTSRPQQQEAGGAVTTPYIRSPLSSNIILTAPERSPSPATSASDNDGDALPDVPSPLPASGTTASNQRSASEDIPQAQAPAESPDRPLEHETVEGDSSATPRSASPIDVPMGSSESLYAAESYTQTQQLEEPSPLPNSAAIAYPPSAQNQQTPDQYHSSPAYHNAAASSSGQQSAKLYPGQGVYGGESFGYGGAETTLPPAYPPGFLQLQSEQQYQPGSAQQQIATLFEQYRQYEAMSQANERSENWYPGTYQNAQEYQYLGQTAFSEPTQYAAAVNPSSNMYPTAYGYQNAGEATVSAASQYIAPVDSSPGFHQNAYGYQLAGTSQYAAPVTLNSGMQQDVPGYQDAGGASFSEASQYPLLMNLPIESDQAGRFANHDEQQQTSEQPQTYTAEEIAYLNQANAGQQYIPGPVQHQQYGYNAPMTAAADLQESDYVHAPLAMQTELAPRLVQPVYRLPVEDDSPVLPAADSFHFEFDVPDDFTLQDAEDAIVAQAIAGDALPNFDWNNVDPNLLLALADTPVDEINNPQDFDWSQLPLPPLPPLPAALPNVAVDRAAMIDPGLAPFNLPPPETTDSEEELERSLDFLQSVVGSYQSDANPLRARFDLPAVDSQGGPLNLAGAAANAEFARQQTQQIIFGEQGRRQFESAYDDVFQPANGLAGPSSQPYSVTPFGVSSDRKRRASEDEEEDDTETVRSKSSRLSTNQDATQLLSPRAAPVAGLATPPDMEPEFMVPSLPADPAAAASNPSALEQGVGVHSGPATPATERSTTPALEAEGAAMATELGKRNSPENDNLDSGRHKRTRSKDGQDVTQAHSPPAAPPAAADAELSTSSAPTSVLSVRQLSAKALGKRRALTVADDEKD